MGPLEAPICRRKYNFEGVKV